MTQPALPTTGEPLRPPEVAGSPADDLPEQLRIRRAKYDRLRAEGRDPFPVGVARTHSLAEVRARYTELQAEAATGEWAGVTGRVIFLRNTGKLAFAVIREEDADLQLMVSQQRAGAESLARWKSDVDLGDLVFARGEVVSSRRGELSVMVDDWALTGKALRPLPVAHRPLSEEARVRQRYLDLIVAPEARSMVRTRANVLASLRSTLARQDYLELETPVLQVVHGGAAARPFVTHLNAFDQDVSLRIATELFLKRALVGGFARVYEIGRVFRNEGVDSTHSPEFTELEAYEAYGDYDSMAVLTRSLIVDAADALGITDLVGYTPGGRAEIDLRGQWREVTVFHLVSEVLGESVDPSTSADELRRLAAPTGVTLQPDWDAGEIVLQLYEKLVEHTLVQPTFVRDYPASVRPLARPHRSDPRLAEAWDLVIGGVEIGPAYSELADPVEQRRRLLQQSTAAAAGDLDAMQLDEDFLRALEHAMPPAGGMGLGVDRLIMLLTGRGIRDTILFPLLRPL